MLPAGVILQEAPIGAPEQMVLTDPVSPFSGVRVTSVVKLCPARIIAAESRTFIVKSFSAALLTTWTKTLDEDDKKLVSPG